MLPWFMPEPAASPAPHMDATIVVPCRNERTHIARFLDSLLAQTTSRAFEIIIADGMSDDGTIEVIEAYQARIPGIRLVANAAKIAPTGLNLAIRKSRGTYIVRMDVHTEYASDYLDSCLDAIESHPGVENVGGPARTRSKSYFQHANQLAYHSPFSVGGAAFHDVDFEGEVDTVPYGCWRRAYLERIGMFDEDFVRNQDDELNLRITRAGGKIWQSPRIRSWYYPRSSFRSLFNQYKQYGYWKVLVIRKHRLPASPRHLVPGAFVAALAVLSSLSFTFSAVRWALAATLGAYLGGACIASAFAARKRGDWVCLPILPMIFFAYHFGYGWGFLTGAMDFWVLKKGGRTAFAGLTR